MVPKEHNPKAIGLFLSAYSNLYSSDHDSDTRDFIHKLARLLIQLKSKGYSGNCWGYNFGWQARRHFYFPPFTPTIVATTYAANGLLDAYECTGEEEYLNEAIGSAPFICNNLIRTPRKNGFIFSYAPLKGNNLVYNASMLASRLLSRIFFQTGDVELFRYAKESLTACCDAQNDDGSWYYGELPVQHWIDSFHTGFNLESLADFQKYTSDLTFEEQLEKGTQFYLDHFFSKNGMPGYYHNKVFPVDIHSPAQLIITLSKLDQLKTQDSLVEKVVGWTLHNMYNVKKGGFIYQKRPLYTNRIMYMRCLRLG